MAENSTLAPAEERGRTVIADKVVERVAAMAAREVQEVADTSGGLRRLTRGRLPAADAVVAGGTSRISVEVAVVWPTPLSRVTTEVRDRVSARVEEYLGMQVSAVDVRVAEMTYDDHQSAPRVQ